jgi:NifU-like protein involved in Fe-S cluster formation
MDHVLSPRNGGPMKAPSAIGKASLNGRAPYVHIYLRVMDSVVTEAMFQTFGCGYSIACCSQLTVTISQLSIEKCHAITSNDLVASLDGIPEEKRFCADMAIAALRDALQNLTNQG